jgi:alanine racemase
MDQILVDVSAVGPVVAGDEAVIIGEQGAERILARELADAAGTISWDIFTGLGNRVKRLYLNQPLTAK